MKNSTLNLRIVFICILIVFVDCKKDDGPPLIPTGRTKSYTVSKTDLSNISGTVVFVENDNNSTTINFTLLNTSAGVDYPINLRRKTAFQGGELAAILGNLNGGTSKGSFTISQLANGQKISYEELLVFDGYLAIGLGDNSGKYAAYSDIGPNEFTGNQVIYSMLSPEDFSFKAQITFAERLNGTTAAIIGLLESNNNETYPSHVHNEQNEILLSLSSVEGRLGGFGFSEITELNGSPLQYDDLLELDASVDVHSSTDSTKIIAVGGIGSNPNAILQN